MEEGKHTGKGREVALSIRFNGQGNIIQIGSQPTGVRYGPGQHPDEMEREVSRGADRQGEVKGASRVCSTLLSLLHGILSADTAFKRSRFAPPFIICACAHRTHPEDQLLQLDTCAGV